jgi:hypothetical protein
MSRTRKLIRAGAAVAIALAGWIAIGSVAAPAALADSPGAGSVVTVSPARLLDTRSDPGQSALDPNATRSLTVTGVGGVPSQDVSAVILNVTVTQPTSFGYLTVWGHGATRPTASNLNFLPDQTVPNLVIAPVGTGGQVDFYNGSIGTLHLVVDVSGYVVAGNATAPGALNPLAPARLLDTREGSNIPVPADTALPVPVAGHGGVPDNAAAVILNVTATQPTSFGYITAYGHGAARPNASNLNFDTGQTVPNLVIVPIGTNGDVDLYNGSVGTTHLIADVFGYINAGDPTAIGSIESLAPARILDTRTNTGGTIVHADGTLALPVGGEGGLPYFDVAAVILNVTVTQPTGFGYLTVYGDGSPPPTASNLNYIVGQTVPNMVIAPVGADGEIDFHNGGTGDIHIIADVSGYILATQSSPRWHTPAPITAWNGTPSGISCPMGITFCMAVDAAGNALTSDGTAWSAPSRIDSGLQTRDGSGFRAVACASASFCVALEPTRAFVYRDGSWSGPTDLADAQSLAGLSCPTTTYCVAVDGPSGDAFTFDGTSWSGPVFIDPAPAAALLPNYPPVTLTGVSCPSPAYCMAIDSDGQYMELVNGAWTAPAWVLVGADLLAVDCTAQWACHMVDRWSRTFDWSQFRNGWYMTVQSYVAAQPVRAWIDCLSQDVCIVVDDAGLQQLMGPGGWNAPVRYGTGYGGVSCSSASKCIEMTTSGYAIGINPSVPDDSTVTGGGPVDLPHGDLVAASCASASHCAAMDSEGNLITSAGGTWSAGPSAPLTKVVSMSCPVATMCAAVDLGGDVAIFDGSNWSTPQHVLPPTTPGQPADAIAVSCASATMCVIIGEANNGNTDGGWTSTYTGSTWTAPIPSMGQRWTAVSCVAGAGFCMAVGRGGVVSTWSGAAWTALPTIGDQPLVEGVSCASAIDCVLLEGNQVRVFDGTGWSPAHQIADVAYPEQLTAIACASAHACVVVSSGAPQGLAISLGASGWSAPRRADSSPLAAVSCVPNGSCTAVDGKGNAVVYS